MQLHHRADQRHHDLDDRRLACFQLVAGRFGDGPDLQREQAGDGEPEPDTAQSEHRVCLVQTFHSGQQLQVLRVGLTGGLGERDLHAERCAVGQELVQRRVQQPNVDGQSVHGVQQPGEVGPLQRQQDGQRGGPFIGGLGQDHFFDQRAPVTQEHVLGAAEPDSLCAEGPRTGGVFGGVRIGADHQPASGIGVTQDPVYRPDQGRCLVGDSVERGIDPVFDVGLHR